MKTINETFLRSGELKRLGDRGEVPSLGGGQLPLWAYGHWEERMQSLVSLTLIYFTQKI